MLRDLRDPASFTVCFHLLPYFGAMGRSSADLGAFVEKAVGGGRIGTFLLADEPLEGEGLSPASLAEDIVEAGGVPAVSFSPRGRSREEIVERLRTYHEAGVRDLLVVTGNYPAGRGEDGGDPGFDLDSVQLFMFLREAAAGRAAFLADFSMGCVVSPFKKLEGEVMWQYAKLARKAEVGAAFAVSQAGYDPRTWDELVRFRRRAGLSIPLVGNLLLPGAAAGTDEHQA